MHVSVLVNSNRPWDEVVRVAQTLDEAGAHAVYVPDHFMPNTEDGSIVDGPRLEAWTMLTALSQLTSSCRLGALVLGGTYRHPAIVANMVASLDTVSGGRAIAGLGAGWAGQRARGVRHRPDVAARPLGPVRGVRARRGLAAAGAAHDVRGPVLPAPRRAEPTRPRAGPAAGPRGRQGGAAHPAHGREVRRRVAHLG